MSRPPPRGWLFRAQFFAGRDTSLPPAGCQRKPVRTAHFLGRAAGQVPTWRNESRGKSQAASQESPCKAPRRQARRLMLAQEERGFLSPSLQASPACRMSQSSPNAGCHRRVLQSPGRGDEGPPHQGQCPPYPMMGGTRTLQPASHLSGPFLGRRCLHIELCTYSGRASAPNSSLPCPVVTHLSLVWDVSLWSLISLSPN